SLCLGKAAQRLLLFYGDGLFPALIDVKFNIDSTVAKTCQSRSTRGVDFVVLRRLREIFAETLTLLRNAGITVEILHVSGKLNHYADRASRLHEDIDRRLGSTVNLATVANKTPVLLDAAKVLDLQKNDPLISAVMSKIESCAETSMTPAEKGLSYGCALVDGLLKRCCDRGSDGNYYLQLVLPPHHEETRSMIDCTHA
ncbi:hypothetical protein FOZ63_020473, partial [Perkinsus olseni]